ncbi:MAG: M48 family metalloprotease [Gammaproteobacteria bacterium]|nr:M48 family metalloprotease [Gammaproteobacteria bacterium]
MTTLSRQTTSAIACLALLANSTAWPQSVNDDLPDIGSPADSVLSKQQELMIGRQIYSSLRDTGRVVSDPEIQEYIQDVGQKLVVNAQDGGFKFNFFVVDDPAINAFALPGGYIGIHSGLLMATANESELAGVMAHEIAHVTQRHISRAIYANQRMSILTMAAMLGAILLGAASGSSDATQGAIMAAQGISAQQQINFTRENEYEADRVGVGILARSGFDPNGMPAFFETLGRQTGPLAAQAPEFLRTHPVTTNRIAETRNRAAEYGPVERQDAAGYSLTRARLQLLSAPTPEKAMAKFAGDERDPDRVGDLGVPYGMALAKLQLGRNVEALEDFQTLLASHPQIIHFHTGLAAAQLAVGDSRGAERTYEEAMKLFPRNRPLTIRYAEALVQNDNPEQAHKILLDLYNQVPPTPEQVRQLALAASAAGDTADAHYYMAEYHLLNGDLTMATDQLRLALSIPGLDAVQKARFRSRLDQVNAVLTPRQQANRGGQRSGSRQ